MIEQLNPDMTISEVANILYDQEKDTWSEYIEPHRFNLQHRPNKITIEEATPSKNFLVTVDEGSNEGIFLVVKSMACRGKTTPLFIGKTLEDPDSERWDECWRSAGRIARALNRMW